MAENNVLLQKSPVMKLSLTFKKKKKKDLTFTGVAQLLGYHPAKQKVTGSIPSQAHARVAGSVPDWVHAGGNTSVYLSHIDVSLPFFLPPFTSL